MSDVYPFHFEINREKRQSLKSHKPFVIWFYGLSGAGKSTISSALESKLWGAEIHTANLDGDVLRTGLNSDLGFEMKDRDENIRRAAYCARILYESGLVVLCSLITPLNSQKQRVLEIIGQENILFVYVNSSFETCQKRDAKGIYRRVSEGKIKNLSGCGSLFEVFEGKQLEVNSEKNTKEEIIGFLFTEIISKIKSVKP